MSPSTSIYPENIDPLATSQDDSTTPPPLDFAVFSLHALLSEQGTWLDFFDTVTRTNRGWIRCVGRWEVPL
ncbi:hypothetical protein JTE90_000577 [Oedothorax gibbosus]|uniref:Uncharacterized protein n=1 Tax=Oedothorax gibbosus TaxID=931172 RepID=A0AAV6VXP1_9ARAC|nr:hypothetical protein JTE90_000577 [Oedothorax gibbosus]